MTRYIARRLVLMVPVLLGVTLILFVLIRLRGDPVAAFVTPEMSAAEVEAVRVAYGFDRPLPEQYATMMARLLQGDFGRSIRYRTPAIDLILERLPATAQLAATALALAVLISLPLGLLSALYPNSLIDLVATTLSTLGRAMPNYWVGIMFILLFGVQWRWFPVSGRDDATSLVMPALTLSFGIATTLTRLLRSSMLEVVRMEYMVVARAKGLREWTVILRHGLRNALIPVLTVFGLQMAWLLGGAVIIEQVFAWPGMGRIMIQAVQGKDMAVVQAGVFIFALIVMFSNLAVDVLYAFIDPRIRYS
ncbi:MAG: ABC transporter permease [Anaerolineae bacterium]|nr:ABC transporter permease [Anaerolineae bacterium]